MRLPLVKVAALVFVLSASAAAATPQPISIELSNFKFTPKDVSLHHGESYTLHLVNEAGGGHDLVAKQFFAAAHIAPEDRGKVKDGEVELDGHQSIDIHLVAPAARTYEMHCSHFMHQSFGMKGAFVVS